MAGNIDCCSAAATSSISLAHGASFAMCSIASEWVYQNVVETLAHLCETSACRYTYVDVTQFNTDGLHGAICAKNQITRITRNVSSLHPPFLNNPENRDASRIDFSLET